MRQQRQRFAFDILGTCALPGAGVKPLRSNAKTGA
jgi:hypothetical protein